MAQVLEALPRLPRMIDLRAARGDPDTFRAALARKGAAEVFDELLAADERWREIQPRVEELRAQRKIKGKPTPEQLEELNASRRSCSGSRSSWPRPRPSAKSCSTRVPNPPRRRRRPTVTPRRTRRRSAAGASRRRSTSPRAITSSSRGGIDIERAAQGLGRALRVSSSATSRCSSSRSIASRSTGSASRGFSPVLPPVLVREEAMYGTGFFPTDEVNIYAVERDELYLVGTSEVPLAAMHGGEILDGDELPLRYAGYSTCFRREAGAAGKDTRGMFRVHQFDKVEMFVFTRPEWSREEHDRLLEIEEELVQELELPYRVVNVAAGDLGASATKKYDIEAWFPSQERYREITSTSNTTDYQARRLEIRHRRGEKQLEPSHTLNGTAVTGRAMLAIMENFQEDDGSVPYPRRCTSSARRRSSAPNAPTRRACRPRPALRCADGGVPERPNGAVLKTADRRKAVRGFKSHPRRFNLRPSRGQPSGGR